MSNRILLKRTSVGNSVPLVGDLEYGELAINYADGNLFYRTSDDAITVIASNKDLSLSGNLTSGGVNTETFTASGTVELGQVSNVSILGGSSGQVLETDGSGNLSWVNKSVSFPSYLHILNRDGSETSIGIQMPVFASVREYFVYDRDSNSVALPTYTS